MLSPKRLFTTVSIGMWDLHVELQFNNKRIMLMMVVQNWCSFCIHEASNQFTVLRIFAVMALKMTYNTNPRFYYTLSFINLHFFTFHMKSPNMNGSTVEVWEWISNPPNPHIWACDKLSMLRLSYSMLLKGPLMIVQYSNSFKASSIPNDSKVCISENLLKWWIVHILITNIPLLCSSERTFDESLDLLLILRSSNVNGTARNITDNSR